mmetsp:Transcript_54334/g.154769  ORF Transcript_54334/g.154769 Transcript_54334/m.154769 type:complete len:435 (-) Transcript_54334:591-1895(-)
MLMVVTACLYRLRAPAKEHPLKTENKQPGDPPSHSSGHVSACHPARCPCLCMHAHTVRPWCLLLVSPVSLASGAVAAGNWGRGSRTEGPVVGLQRAVCAPETVLELIRLDHQGRGAVKHRRPDKAVEAIAEQSCAEELNSLGAAAVRSIEALQRGTGTRVNEVQAAEGTEAATTGHGRVLVNEALDLLAHDWLQHALRAAHKVVLQHVLDALVARSERDRVRLEGRTPAEGVGLEVFLDVLADSHHGKRQVRACEALGAGHDVGHHVVVLEPPEAACAAEAHHDLVADHEHAILVAECTHTLHVPLGREVHATRAHDGLEHDRGDGTGPLALDLLLKEGQGPGRPLLVCRPEGKEVRIGGVHGLHKARGRALALGKAPTEVAGGAEGALRASVVGAIVRQDLGPAGEAPRDADCRLIGLCAARGEEEAAEVAGQ